MNIHQRVEDREPSRGEAEAALDVLRAWANRASDADLAALDPRLMRLIPGLPDPAYPVLARDYPSAFTPDEAYKRSMPDLQNGPASLIRGANTPIQHVGISNFRLPVKFRTREGGDVTLQASVTGTVSLEADKKGINMSRIMRSFYQHAEKRFSVRVIEAALDDYKADLGSFDARIQMRFSFPMKVESLRSGLSGWQYYDIALELVDKTGERRTFMHLDYVYSSTCPCSLELSEHARAGRGQLATPHSQRSVARLSVEVMEGKVLWFEDLIDLCRRAVPTETQVMVKR
ncbi:MAG: GTP cyclohydrolase I FolE2, partial [Rhodobacteraceae bacterium]|nr:GTP cyclohydrolase I FolE2 [Paracoccaceae bacterium]